MALILVLWYTSDENLGDFYIYQTVSRFAHRWGHSVCDMDVGSPYAEIAKRARHCDWLWFAGGGIIERGIPDIIRNFKKFYKRARHIEYGITGLSIGDFDYSDYAASLRFWVDNAHFFFTRDDYSASVLNDISSVKSVRASVDVVFAHDAFRLLETKKSSDILGISFRTMPYPDLTGEIDLDSWNNAIQDAYSGPKRSIPDQLDVPYQFDFDTTRPYSPEEAVYVIKEMGFGLAMRYHVVLIAAILGKACIPITYCPKVSRLAEQIGLSELCIRFDEPEKLSAIVSYYLTHKEEINNQLERCISAMQTRAEEMFNYVRKVMVTKR